MSEGRPTVSGVGYLVLRGAVDPAHLGRLTSNLVDVTLMLVRCYLSPKMFSFSSFYINFTQETFRFLLK